MHTAKIMREKPAKGYQNLFEGPTLPNGSITFPWKQRIHKQ